MKQFIQKFSLEGRKAIVTGGAKGLCNGMANALHEAGAEVLLLDVLDQVTDSASEMGQTGAPVHAVKGDLSDFDHLGDVYAECLEKLDGRVDILLNGAGIQFRAPAVDFPPRQMAEDHRHQPDRSFLPVTARREDNAQTALR